MKKQVILSSILVLFLLFFSFLSKSQILQPVKWEFSKQYLLDNEAELVITAKIEKNWYLYSQNIKPGGPIPTNFKFNKSSTYKLIGKTNEPEPEKKYDDNFEMDLLIFHNKVDFRQKIRILSKDKFTIKGSLEFMCCDNKRCLPPEEVDFSFDITQNLVTPEPETQIDTKQDSIDATKQTINSDTANSPDSLSNNNNNNNTIQTQNNIPTASEGLTWTFFFIALLAGFAGILTPCVFPMIPMTVNFFLNKKGSRRKKFINVIFYGLSIIIIYTAIGLIVSLLKADANVMNQVSSHWLTNILFFSIFIIFAMSFLGLFEITLPSKLVNKSDEKVDKGGFMSSFFMALTLVLVSFSCTGPIVGAILIEATSGHLLKPIIGMFGFGFAFALPFMLLAAFPSVLGNLPKSGGWLNSVKIVLGFLILALSFKFLITADQAYHWNLLSRDLVIAIWIVIFFLIGLYLLGKLKFSHDTEIKHISIIRLFLAIIAFVFVIYLLPGMFGAPLKTISAFLPPQTAQNFDLSKTVAGNQLNPSSANLLCDKPKYSDILSLPHNLQGYFDYQQGLSCARKQNKPIFLVFTGHSCGNCHKMENDVWSDPRVQKILSENYIIITLFTDDRTSLPENEHYKSSFDGKIKNTIGKKNADFRITRFKANTQPFYVLLDTKEQMLTSPYSFDTNVEKFIAFLNKGLKKS